MSRKYFFDGTRRGFLRACLGGLPVLFATLFIFRKDDSAITELLSGAGFLSGAVSAKRIGQKYLAQLEEVPRPVDLLNEIFEDVSLWKRHATLQDREKFWGFIARKGVIDFQSNRVVNVEGFYFSSTELKACLLATFS